MFGQFIVFVNFLIVIGIYRMQWVYFSFQFLFVIKRIDVRLNQKLVKICQNSFNIYFFFYYWKVCILVTVKGLSGF